MHALEITDNRHYILTLQSGDGTAAPWRRRETVDSPAEGVRVHGHLRWTAPSFRTTPFRWSATAISISRWPSSSAGTDLEFVPSAVGTYLEHPCRRGRLAYLKRWRWRPEVSVANGRRGREGTMRDSGATERGRDGGGCDPVSWVLMEASVSFQFPLRVL